MSSNNNSSNSDNFEWEEWNPDELTFLQHMVAGSFAGLAEHISIFPIDTLKTHIQCERCGSTSMFQTWTCASRIVHKEGIFRLWRGVSATFAGCIPAHAAYFSIYEFIKMQSGANLSGHHPVAAAFAGACAVIGHDLCMIPFDLVKQRMQLGYYNSFYQCVRSVYMNEGLFGFYVSLPTTLLMNIPHGCVQIAINESCRKFLAPSGVYTTNTFLLSGCIAGGIAALVTNPMDVVKTRLQTQAIEPCPAIGLSVTGANRSIPSTLKAIDVAKSIIRNYGISGFFRGSTARILVQAPGVAISWTVYENLKILLSTSDRQV